MKKNGIMSGKVFKGTNPNGDEVTYGRNNHKVYKHSVDDLIDNTIGKFNIPYEANGVVSIDPGKVEYLKS